MSANIAAVIGLGNPGSEYIRTRHNAGWWMIDWLASHAGASLSMNKKMNAEVAQANLGGQSVWLVKPQTFMNRSGQSMQALAQFYKLPTESLLVAHDELDLPCGTARLKRGGGHGGHNGLRSAISHCGADFARLRLGIGHPGHRDQVLNYVLKPPTSDEQTELDRCIDRAGDALLVMLQRGWDRATQQLHTKSDH